MMGKEKAAGTTEFSEAVISNLGKTSRLSPPKKYTKVDLPAAQPGVNVVRATGRQLAGLDVYIESELEPRTLASDLENLATSSPLKLEMITNRGAVVFPSRDRKVSLVDH